MPTTKENAPSASGNSAEGNDQNPTKGTIEMNATSVSTPADILPWDITVSELIRHAVAHNMAPSTAFDAWWEQNWRRARGLDNDPRFTDDHLSLVDAAEIADTLGVNIADVVPSPTDTAIEEHVFDTESMYCRVERATGDPFWMLNIDTPNVLSTVDEQIGNALAIIEAAAKLLTLNVEVAE